MAPNGAGKTTIVKCLSGLEKFEGKIIFEDNIDKLRSEALVIWDDSPFYEKLSGIDNLIVFSEEIKIKKKNYMMQVINIYQKIYWIILLFIIINKLSVYFLNIVIKNNIKIKHFTLSITLEKSILIQILLSFLIALTYISIGFLLGNIMRNGLFSFAIIVIYLYIIPIFSKYEIRNCCYAIMKENFDFYGLINISSYKDISNVTSVTLLFLFTISSNIISYLIIKNRQAYK